MMETIQNAIQKMGSNFVVASFVPAMAFVIFSLFAFLPIMPPSMLFYWDQIGDNFIETTIVILVFTTLLGFTLFTLSTFIYKSFEGYTFIFSPGTFFGKSGLKRQKRRVKRIELQRSKLERAIFQACKRLEMLEKIPNQKRTKSTWRQIEKYQSIKESLSAQKYTLLASYNANFPPQELILPTRFGNILRAAETYPGKRYGIDSVELWPRLSHVIPPEGMALIDQSNNECLFLLNSSLLAAISSLLCLLAAGYQYLLSLFSLAHNLKPLYFLEISQYPYIYQQNIVIYILVSAFSAACAWFFYEASLLNVGQFGDMIKSSYDIYRFKLIEALHIPLPKTLRKEYDVWSQISNFYSTGFELDFNIDFKYSHLKK